MLRRNDEGKVILVDDEEAVKALELVASSYNKFEIDAYLDEVIFVRQFREKQVNQIVELLTLNPDMWSKVYDLVTHKQTETEANEAKAD